MTVLLYFIVDTYVKSRENPENQYWPYQVVQYEKQICIGRFCPALADLYYLYHKGSFHLIYVNTTVVD